MKFPRSVHAEGWANHIDTTPSDVAPAKAMPSGGRTKRSILHEPLHASAQQPLKAPAAQASMAAPSPAAPFRAAAASAPYVAPPSVRHGAATTAPARRSGPNLWLIGTGVGVALIGLAVTMSRTLSPVDTGAPPTAVVSQAQPTPSPEDALLQAQPPSAGPVTPAPEAQPAETAVAAPPPAAEPPAKAAAPKPAENAAPTLPVVRGDPTSVAARPPAPAPVREAALQPLTPAPSQTTPAPVVPPVAVAPTLPTPPMTAPAPAMAPPVMATAPVPATAPVGVPAETAAPVVAQAQPQPPVVNPEDAGITVKVRTALAADATLAAVPIAVSTEQGVVKLEGQAPDTPTRDRATVVAAATLGVKAVDNRLTVPPMATVGAVTQGSGH